MTTDGCLEVEETDCPFFIWSSVDILCCVFFCGVFLWRFILMMEMFQAQMQGFPDGLYSRERHCNVFFKHF